MLNFRQVIDAVHAAQAVSITPVQAGNGFELLQVPSRNKLPVGKGGYPFSLDLPREWEYRIVDDTGGGVQ